jgi:hypothetical protein
MHWIVGLALLLAPLVAGGEELAAGKPFVISFVRDSATLADTGVVREAYARLGIEVRLEGFLAAEALAAANAGQVDAELQRIGGAQRRFPNLIQVPIPVNELQATVLSGSYDFPVRGWHSLRPYRVGIVKGILFSERGTAGMDVRVAPDYPQLLGWLADKTVDVAVVPRLDALEALRVSRLAGIQELDGVLETMFLYHYVHERHGDLVPRLQAVLKQMLLDGTTRRLRDAAHARVLGGGS